MSDGEKKECHVSWSARTEEAHRGAGEDRLATLVLPDRFVALVADGAGGTSGGAAAAEALCQALLRCAPKVPASWAGWMEEIDRMMAASASCGLAAAVVVEIKSDGALSGASVGDCEAWIFGEDEPTCLTAGQIRKPLLGSGDAAAVPFAAHLAPKETLVVGSDGLWKYLSALRICEAARIRPLNVAVGAMIEGVKLPSGTFQDDIAVVAAAVDAPRCTVADLVAVLRTAPQPDEDFCAAVEEAIANQGNVPESPWDV